MSEPLDAETTEKLEKISEETFGNSMIYVMPYIYMEGRIRKDGSVLFYVFQRRWCIDESIMRDDSDIRFSHQKSEDRLTLK